jgi:hypothetical protein
VKYSLFLVYVLSVAKILAQAPPADSPECNPPSQILCAMSCESADGLRNFAYPAEYATNHNAIFDQSLLGWSFDGSSSVIVYPTVWSAPTNVTITCWVNLPSTACKGLFWSFGAVYDGGAGDGICLGINDGGTDFVTPGNVLTGLAPNIAWIQPGQTIGTGWKQITCTLSGKIVRLYVNAQLIFTQTNGLPHKISTTHTTIGNGANNNWPSDAVVADLRVYDIVLSDAAIADIYHQSMR